MAALAPIPRASVAATVIHRARTRASERTAILKSRKNDMSLLRSDSCITRLPILFSKIHAFWTIRRFATILAPLIVYVEWRWAKSTGGEKKYFKAIFVSLLQDWLQFANLCR